MIPSAPSLSALSAIHGSDKYGSHFYTERYEAHLSKYKDKPVLFVEIGVGGYADPLKGGQSLRMWSDWFSHPDTRIIGIDIEAKSLNIQDPRVFFRQGSQTDPDFLASILQEFGAPDIVLDDGSHDPSHVIASFEILFPALRDGGTYIVEDTQTSYWDGFGSVNLQDPTHTFFKRFVDYINYAEIPSKKPPSYYELHTTGLHFYHNLVILDKAPNLEPSNILPSRLTPATSDTDPLITVNSNRWRSLQKELSLTAHLGGHGDIHSPTLSIKGNSASFSFIQGVLIATGPTGKPVDLRTRVMNQAGDWSDYSPINTFAGTRGLNANIFGIQILSNDYPDLQVVGLFAGAQEELCIAPVGSPCQQEKPEAPLVGLQLLMT